jgi:hypothetical protein
VAWLNRLLDTNRIAVSLQVLNETYSGVRRKPHFAHWRPGHSSISAGPALMVDATIDSLSPVRGLAS